MNEKLYIVSELYYPEDTSTGYFLTKIAEGLAIDRDVAVLCSQPTYSQRGMNAPRFEMRNGVSILRSWGTRLNKDILPLRILNFLTISFSLLCAGLWNVRSGEKVLVVTNPPILPFLIMLVCRLKRAELVLLVHDVYPEVLAAAGMIQSNSVSFRLVQRCVRWLYRGVALVVVLGRDMANLAATKCDPRKVRVIPNWADLEEVSPESIGVENPLRNACGLRDSFVVQYCGNMGRTHGLECLLHAAGRAMPDTHYLLIGSGARKEWLKRQITVLGLSNVTVLPRCPRERLSEYLNACDLAVISFLAGMNGVSVPSRMYNVMAAGRPILAIADTSSELAMVVTEERIGWVVAPGDIDGIVRAVDEARTNPALLRDMGIRARKVVEEKYNLPRVIGMYRDMFATL